MPRYKCSDFYCLQIFTYPSILKMRDANGKLIKNADDPAWHIEARKLVQDYFKFLDGFLQEIFQKPSDFFYLNYMCYREEAINEMLDIMYNIKHSNNEGYYQFLIPSDYINLIYWMQQNKPEHSKEPTKFRISHLTYMTRDGYFFVHEALNFARRQRQNHPQLPALEEIDLINIRELT